jgi:hypothetical protein
MERRRNARLEINRSCRLTSPRFGRLTLVGITENMSRGDVMVLLPEDCLGGDLPLVGDPMLVEIDLPANHAFGRKCMQCQTTVVRVGKSETGAPRLSMRIHKMRFQSCGEDCAAEERPGEALQQLLM